MGYNTNWNGALEISPPLSVREVRFLEKFFESRHDTGHCVSKDPKEKDILTSIENMGTVWCNLAIDEDGETFYWNGSEKTYSLPEWIQWLIDNILGPNALCKKLDDPMFSKFQEHTVSGEMRWTGEDAEDAGVMTVKNNKVVTTSLDQLVTKINETEKIYVSEESATGIIRSLGNLKNLLDWEDTDNIEDWAAIDAVTRIYRNLLEHKAVLLELQ